ncbi:MAG: AbrB/MazE/SpoVT family DNA-binding domain-containing protein [Deltaproteobacteria bacterium]|nr:AbrB/MazE/SpoVT family DNA-binding domain-containing protein [Deltaproteobacteria bacterium]
MSLAQISSKGQLLIPKKIRNKYGVRPGRKVHILEQTEGILIKPAPEDPLETACGFIKGDFSLTEDLLKEHRKEQSHETTRRPR